MRLSRVFAVSLLLYVFAAAAPAAVEVRDDAGHALRLQRPAQRIVALAPHLTELVYAAGAGDRLVGVMRFSDQPAEAASKPVVGDAVALNVEAIAALHPDLILVWGSGTNERQKARLMPLGVPIFESEIEDVAGMASTLERLGELTGRSAPARAAAADVRARWQALRDDYAGRPAVRVFYALWDEPLMAPSGHHLIGEAISACGGTNNFAALPTLVATVSLEAAVRSDPEVVIVAGGSGKDESVTRWQAFRGVAAVRNGHVLRFDGEAISRMSPRFVDAARRLCETIDAARPP